MRCFLSHLLLCFVFCGAAVAQVPQWQIEDIIIPPNPIPGHSSFWAEAHPMGDLTSSGRASYWLAGVDFYLHSSGQSGVQHPIGILDAGLGAPKLPVSLPVDSGLGIFGSVMPFVAMLRTPSGWHSVTLREYTSRLLCFTFPGNQLVTSYAPPSPLPGTGEYLLWTAIQNAGDINLDGFDDLFATGQTTGHNGVFALLDGASFSITWYHFVPGAADAFYATLPTPTKGFPDVNGDGIPDFIAGANAGQPSINERVILALSGIDGSVIFDTRLSTQGADSGITSMDISGDGIADVVTQAGQELVAINGTNGQILWQSSVQDLLPFLPPGQWLAPRNPVFFGDVPANGAPEFVHALVSQNEIGDSVRTDYIGTFRCSDGGAVGAFRLRGSLEPFLPDDYQGQNYPHSYLLGDIDRDGLTEIGHMIQVLSLATPDQPLGPHVMAVYSQRTLEFPEVISVSQGQPHVADFHIPSAGNMSLMMLFSTTFNYDSGFTHDHWNTFLGEDRMFGWSRNQMFTQLNPSGEGSISFSLPNHPALIGRYLYARGVVLDPSDPINKVWTMSTLGTGVCTP